MNYGLNSETWWNPSLIAALAALVALAALPAVPAAAHGSAHDKDYTVVIDCELGSFADYSKSCVFDTNGDGGDDWWVYDTDGDGIYDTSQLDTDFDSWPETFYTIVGSPSGEVRVRYDHDGDGLYDDQETWLHYTDPYNRDTDWDGYNDGQEAISGSDPLNPWCTPYGCG
jgi:hypothetical protein